MKQKEERDFYEKVSDWNFDIFDIKSERLTNWDMYETLKKITNENSRILDLGTGGGEKVLANFPKNVKEIIATDFSSSMIETANNNLKKSDRKNVTFKTMDNLNMNLPKEYFDVVVARNTVTDPKQIYEVLKPGGYLIIRGVDKYDCHELKMIFGKEQTTNTKPPISIIDYENTLAANFEDVELVPIHEREYFKSPDIFYEFLLKVPIIDDFSEVNSDYHERYKNVEREKLEKYINRNTYPNGIRLIRRYYGITAKKGNQI